MFLYFYLTGVNNVPYSPAQVWIEFAKRCEYLEDEICNELDEDYDQIMGQIVNMINQADKWLIK
jgi:hypothetical protein